MMEINYKTHGVCSRQINVEVEEGIVKNVRFVGGCNGNTSGISNLVVGMKVEDVIEKLKDVDCNGRGTSCPAQLAEALKLINVEENTENEIEEVIVDNDTNENNEVDA